MLIPEKLLKKASKIKNKEQIRVDVEDFSKKNLPVGSVTGPSVGLPTEDALI